jgi:hypothetical protein
VSKALPIHCTGYSAEKVSGPLNKRKERADGFGKLSTHSLFPSSVPDVSSSLTSFTAGIDKRRYSWHTSISTSRLAGEKRCPAQH